MYVYLGNEVPKNKRSILKSENNKLKTEKTKPEGEIHEVGCKKTESETEPKSEQEKSMSRTAADGR